MISAEQACGWLCTPESKVSCHYLIDEAGHITQLADENLRAWHAGQSAWQGETDINSFSIGIEIHNPGHAGGYPDFPLAQMKSVGRLCQDIVARHDMRPEGVLAHSDVAPGRKIDPGEKFDWQLLHSFGVGHWVEPAPISPGEVLREDDGGEPVLALQMKLARYGYGLEPSGIFDSRTRVVVEAFQRHYRPAKVDGIADPSTIITLERLIQSIPVSASNDQTDKI